MEEGDDNLASLGGWPKFHIDERSHQIIRHAYEQTITACARLASFASGAPTKTSGPISERQETLAVDDLVDFAIHARRLIENTTKAPRFRRVALRPLNQEKQELVPILKVINTLIHHQEIVIVRTELQVNALLGLHKRLEDMYVSEFNDLLSGHRRAFPPRVVAKSDRGDYIGIEIQELVEVFQKHVLGPIVDLCDEHSFFLEEF